MLEGRPFLPNDDVWFSCLSALSVSTALGLGLPLRVAWNFGDPTSPSESNDVSAEGLAIAFGASTDTALCASVVLGSACAASARASSPAVSGWPETLPTSPCELICLDGMAGSFCCCVVRHPPIDQPFLDGMLWNDCSIHKYTATKPLEVEYKLRRGILKSLSAGTQLEHTGGNVIWENVPQPHPHEGPCANTNICLLGN